MKKLKPCPFCGCGLVRCSVRYGRNGWFLFVRCGVCGAEGKKFSLGADIPDSDEEFWACEEAVRAGEQAAQLWNMRRCQDA